MTANVDIPALKRRYPLGYVVESSGVELRGRGRVRQGVCPFHEENEGSFTVYADSQRWYCFGCGLGGDVLDFIQRLDGIELPEAIRRLQGGSWEPVEQPRAQVDYQSAEALFARDPQLLTAAVRFYTAELRRSSEALDYLASRGIDIVAASGLVWDLPPEAACVSTCGRSASTTVGCNPAGCSPTAVSASTG